MTDVFVPHANNTSLIPIDRDRYYRKKDSNLKTLIDRYTCGSCGVLATVIHQITGWPVRGIYLYHDDHTVEKLAIDGVVYREHSFTPAQWDKYPSHAICEQPDGLFIDAWGAGQTAEQITAIYRTDHHKRLGIMDVKVGAAPKTDLHTRSPYLYTQCLQQDIKILLPEIYARYQEQERSLCLI